MAGNETYMILGGVRRATASYLEGKAEILAEVLNRDGRVVELRSLPLSTLRSPKRSIDISTSTNWWRFERLRNDIRQGRDVPPILVRRGTRGVPLADISLDTLGDTP